jgi:hypothetical protein
MIVSPLEKGGLRGIFTPRRNYLSNPSQSPFAKGRGKIKLRGKLK